MTYNAVLGSGVPHSDLTLLYTCSTPWTHFLLKYPHPSGFIFAFSHSGYRKEVSITEELKYFPMQMSYSSWSPQCLLNWGCSGNTCWMDGWVDGWMNGQWLRFISNKAIEVPAGVILLSLSWAPWHWCCGQQQPLYLLSSSWGVHGADTAFAVEDEDAFYMGTAGTLRFPTEFTWGHLFACVLVIFGTLQRKTQMFLWDIQADTMLDFIIVPPLSLRVHLLFATWLWRHSAEVVLTLDSDFDVCVCWGWVILSESL